MLSQILVFTVHENIKKSYKNNRFEISVPTTNEEFELPDESYSISDIQDDFEYMLKKHGQKQLIIQSFIKIYINKMYIKSRLKLKQDIILNF